MNKHPHLALALVLSGCLLAGCNRTRSTGELLDGKETGTWHYWYANGQRERTGSYQNGVEEGLWTYWYESGQRQKTGAYRQGKPEGKWTYWYEDGQKAKEGNFDNGSEQGEWVHWHQNGQRSQVRILQEGRQVATKNWDPRGKAEADASLSKELDGLIEDLKNRSSSISDGAVAKLQNMGAAVVPAMAQMLREQNKEFRVRGLKVLQKIGKGIEPQADQVIPVLMECLSDPDESVRQMSMLTFVAMGPSCVPNLAATLKRGASPNAQMLAAVALAEFKAESKAAIPELIGSLASPSEFVRGAAVDALSSIGPDAVPALVGLLNDPASGNNEKLSATKALGKIGAEAAPAAEALTNMLTLASIKADATAALVKIGAPAVKPLIALLCDGKHENYREAASRALSRIGEPAVSALAAELKNPDAKVRTDVATTLADIGSKAKAALPSIEAQYKVETDDTAKEYLNRAMTRINSAN